MNYHIRAASNDDALQISDMMIAHAHHEGHQLIIDKQLDALTELQKHPLFIYVVEDRQTRQLVGYMSLVKQYSTWDMDWYLYLDCLFLEENTRGEGLGKQMMHYALDFANDLGMQLMQWQTPIDNKDAIKFYQKLGAEHKAKLRFFWQN